MVTLFRGVIVLKTVQDIGEGADLGGRGKKTGKSGDVVYGGPKVIDRGVCPESEQKVCLSN